MLCVRLKNGDIRYAPNIGVCRGPYDQPRLFGAPSRDHTDILWVVKLEDVEGISQKPERERD